MSGTIPDPVVAPAAEAPAPAPVESPSPPATDVSPAPVVEAPAAPAADPSPAPAAAVPEPAAPASLLSDAAPEAEPLPEPEPPAPLTYSELTFPEGVDPAIAGKGLEPYLDVLGKAQVPAPVVQALFDQFVAEQQRAAAANRETWAKTRQGWVDQFRADPDLGGNRQETTLSRAASVRDRFGGSPAQVQELKDALALTGAGDHPAVIRLLANIAERFKEGGPVPAVMARAVPDRSSPRTRYVNSPTMNGAA